VQLINKFIGIFFILIIIIFSIIGKLITPYLPSPDIEPETLLNASILSLTISLAIFTLMKEKYAMLEPDHRIILFWTGFGAVTSFTIAIFSLYFDIYPIPNPTTKWILVWVFSSIIGWLLQLAFFFQVMYALIFENNLAPESN